MERQKLTPRDWLFIVVCAVLTAAAGIVIHQFFDDAFPQASIDFRVNGKTSEPVARKLLAANGVDVGGLKHAVLFDSDSEARIFLERSEGLKKANDQESGRVHLWYWHHRWFRALQEEEFSVDVAPTGEVVGFVHKIPEERALGVVSSEEARSRAEAFLSSVGVRGDELLLVAQSERALPKRTQRIYTWESKTIRPAGAPYRHVVTIDGNVVSSYEQRLKVPDAWLRSYREMRSKNFAAWNIDRILLGLTMLAALIVFIVRLRRGDIHLRFVLGIAVVAAVLLTAVTINSIPAALAEYDTTMSYGAFIGSILINGVMGIVGEAMLLVIVCGAGEVLYRERLPRQLAVPRVFSKRALTSKRVFRALLLGCALVPLFIAYQVVFYVIAQKYGAWSPAEVPYDETMNAMLPWAAVLFAGFSPSLTEEFVSRAFSVPFFERILRSRAAAIVLAGFIWGFGHALYPNQPFFIRGVEVGLAGVALGILMQRFGIVPLLVWHYSVDAIYTALLLFKSKNVYYVLSGATSFIFVVPLVISAALYLRNRGFVPDDDLTNAALPVAPPRKRVEMERAPAELPPPIPVTSTKVIACVAVVALAALLYAIAPPSTDDAADYRIPRDEAKRIATAFLRNVAHQPVPNMTVAVPVPAFRSWDRNSEREDGGSPADYDDVAATYMVHRGLPVRSLVTVMRTRVQAATWNVRFYTPEQKQEYFVEVDPRTSRVIGYHKYQDEKNPGPQLDRDAALAVATRTFATYGLDPRVFVVREALAFQQPARRDWLFHFEERAPIVADAFRRVTVRVAGAEVTQVATTIHIPERVYREASARTLLNVLFFTMKIVGVIALLAIVIVGLVIVTRHGLPWKRAAKLTIPLAILPILGVISRTEWTRFSYSTSTAWQTFRINNLTSDLAMIGVQIALLFVAVAVLEAMFPFALALPRAAGRARFGRSAVVATITALAAGTAVTLLLRLLANAFPQLASVGGMDTPSEVATAWPALFTVAEGLLLAIIGVAAIALFATAVSTWPRGAMPLTIGAVFCAALDAGASRTEAPLMLFAGLVMAGLVWVIARYILNGNPLAWPVALFTAAMLRSAAAMLHHHRPDLMVNAVVLLLLLMVMMIALALRGGVAERA